jgi:hypothetical protein
MGLVKINGDGFCLESIVFEMIKDIKILKKEIIPIYN